MLLVSHLSKSYGIQTILDDVSFVLNPSERAGLVGVNGAGKTTLLRIIAGLEQPDAGLVRLDTHATLGYLPQRVALDDAMSLDELIRQGVAAWEHARREMDAHALQLERDASNGALLTQYGDVVAQFEALGGYAVEARIDEVVRGLGLENVPRDLVIGKLSGGQHTRAGLARLLIAAPSVLLLDEPTNHLDVDALEWLEAFVRAYAGAVLLVSHDRVFLDHTVSQILELDDVTHRVKMYHGNYADYELAKARELEQQWAMYQAQQTERARLILAKLVAEKSNVLLLDEPINHLDIPSRERFQTALDAFPGTILAAAHDRAFIQRFASGFWEIKNGRLETRG